MNYIIDLENIKHKCRVCLTPSNQMISLTCKLEEENDESPEIYTALENIFSVKVNIDPKYPEGVCLICYRRIKISYSLKTTFKKSQYILDKYVSLLKSENSDNNYAAEVSQTQEESLEEDKSELEIDPEDFVKQELIGEELTDYVILQVTDDNEEEENKTQEEDILKDEIDEKFDSVNSKITEFLNPNKYQIEKLASKSRILHNCPFCSKRFLTKRNFDQHTKICQKYTLLKCEFCDQQFSSLMRKHYHVKMKHNNALTKESKCEICNEVFQNQKSRTYHIKTKHALKKFVCKICNKAFHFKNGLATHMDTHTKDQFKEICPECGKGFHYRGGLFYHMKIHRNERNYVCTYCSARFLNISGLKKHIRIHTGEKPCQCEYCGKSFRSTSILNKHEKTHTGHRPHSCKYCGKGFISTYNRKVHMAGHSGNHPCVFCDKSFLNEEVLKLHMKFKHAVKEDASKKEDSE
ncbi:zinc finger protein 664-like [Anoplophora glabripennis]|uniref:zinc finger protein 664-like n=1 Tax=Anoplophora glabripennis TaxID=217634 RepID=UPI0008745660|nr:zinc finger protein 664-like [Anoplophora glabripennis]